MKLLKRIAIISTILSISILVGCDNKTNTVDVNSKLNVETIPVIEAKKYTQEDVYREIRDFMYYDFHNINKNLSNINFINNDYQKVSDEELNKRYKMVKNDIYKIDNMIKLTEKYPNINNFFIEMKEYVTDKNKEVKTANYYIHSGYGAKTTNYDKEGYIFYKVKTALINDDFNNGLIEDWNKNKVE